MKKIELLRKKKNLTRRQLAEMIGVSQLSIEMWENGLAVPSLAKLQKLAEVLECSVDELCDAKGIIY